MLEILAGLGLAFAIAMVIVAVYSAVSVVEYGKEEKLTNGKIAIAVIQLVALTLISIALVSFIGWLIIHPLMPVLLNCG